MRASALLMPTLRENPADAETASHRLMLRAGMIRRVAAGLYNWLPLGLRVIRNVERIVRDELDRSGAQELLMPVVQPAELWQESGRWEKYGVELLRMQDRHQRPFCLGPTHEEVITDIVRRECSSYRQLPLNLYQIQTKFRDEVRPRFGVMRAREFVMKDGYSFHVTRASLDATYADMHACYCRIFERMGLDFRPVLADTGNIGGSSSHEFHVLADSGEDAIAFSDTGRYAANVELAPALPPAGTRPAPGRAIEKVATPGLHSIEAVAERFGVDPRHTVKTLVVAGADDGPPVALLLRGDHDLNMVKAARLPGVAVPVQFADEATVRRHCPAGPGSLGPGLGLTTWADHAALALADFIAGANDDGHHVVGANWDRDYPAPQAADLRNVVEGDPSPDGEGTLKIVRGIEVGHIFKLGTQYSTAMKATVLDDGGNPVVLEMGCYGLGITRVVAAVIEQCHDDAGIIWPQSLAPFAVEIVPIGADRSAAVRDAAEQLYSGLRGFGIEVLLDDRDERPGVKFADADLIGIPHRIVVGARSLADGNVEYRRRGAGEPLSVPLASAIEYVRAALQ